MAEKPGSLKGVALISGGANSTVAGALHFVQDPSTRYTEVRGRVTGLAPGLHGFHIHAFGDTTNGCNSTGPHFNPHNKSHGAPVDDERHVGDLGNIQANKDGVAEVFIKDLQISLSGPHSILGRVVVVYADSDDQGKGVHELCKSAGNARARIGCGIIRIQPTSGAVDFFKSMFEMCRSSYDLSHKTLVLNQETRRIQNEDFRARGIAIPDDGPELEPIAHVNYVMPPIDDFMFYPSMVEMCRSSYDWSHKFFKSMFEMCRSSYDLSHKNLVLNQGTRRMQNEDFRARGIAIPDDGPELEPIVHINYEMPPIDDSMFYPFVDYGIPPSPVDNFDNEEDDREYYDDGEHYDDGAGDEDEEDE